MSNSKEEILGRIKSLQLSGTASPPPADFAYAGDLVDNLTKSLEANHTQVLRLKDLAATSEFLRKEFSPYPKVISVMPDLFSSKDRIEDIAHPGALVDVDACLVPGRVGVAENGAIWVAETDIHHRVLPFIVQHLFIALKTPDLVGNMHQAYAQVGTPEGFGVFIAGPSKTADIEQSLVVGAHGPVKMTVLLLDF